MILRAVQAGRLCADIYDLSRDFPRRSLSHVYELLGYPAKDDIDQTSWGTRPLTHDMINYAVGDVEYVFFLFTCPSQRVTTLHYFCFYSNHLDSERHFNFWKKLSIFT